MAGRAILAGAAYFAIVFAAGFALGTLRVLAIAPAWGERAAVLLELPVMLAICWGACGFTLRRFDLPARARDRLTMGGTAFALLMAAEICVSLFALERDLAGHLAHYATLSGALGLAGQIAFAGFPLLATRRR